MNFKYESCSEAAAAGDLETLKKMHQAGYQWDEWTCSAAADNGHLDCLRYAHSQGCVWNCLTTIYAADSGHLECLKYAYENGCEWNFNIPIRAVSNGHLECLKYAHSKECYWDKYTPKIAAQKGHFECFKYCFQMWNSIQDFWKINFDITKIIDKIDMDDLVWRRLFELDLSKYPELKNKVKNKMNEIEELKIIIKEVLESIFPLDIIQYCIHPLL